jgi:topoisomerase-4 subunit A
VYNLVYLDGKSGRTMIKRFQVLSITRDREYDLTKGAKGSRMMYFTANPNGEAEIITVSLTPASKSRKKVFDFDFADVEIKGRGAGGNILTKYPVRKIQFKSAGVSTLGGLDVWYDSSVGRLNTNKRGEFLGKFHAEDRVVVFYREGTYELTSFEMTNHYDPNQIFSLGKFKPDQPVNAIHYDAESKIFYIKRFLIEKVIPNKRFLFIGESKGSKLFFANNGNNALVEVVYKDGRSKEKKELDLTDLIDIKGWRAIGNKFNIQTVLSIVLKPTIVAEESVDIQVAEPNNEIENVTETDELVDLEQLKSSIKDEVEKEEKQLGLFGDD